MDVMKYRPEIDGLRALAVLPVVLYHAGLPWLPGGFMGVDVFFVISGYLITTIIWGELQADRFSIKRFYERRFRRIVPALLVVVATVLVMALVLALPIQVIETNKSAITALLSVSNFWFWSQSGYFAPAVELMPLLHTWSLAVEEQFYLIFPLVLLAANSLKLNARKWVLWCLPLLFLAALFLSYQKPAVAFYLLPARAWELALGAALALGAIPAVQSPRIASMLAWAGLVMLASGYLFGHSGMLFPGYVALLPCVGTALIIHCARATHGIGGWLAWRPLVLVGLVSYSLYLWHWPVLVFTRMATASMDLSVPVASGAVVVSLIAAILSWRYVEQPFRGRRMPLKRGLAIAGAGTVAILAVAGHGVLMAGYPANLPSAAGLALAVQDDLDPLRAPCVGVNANAECRFGTGAGRTFVVVGDSHAAAMRPAFESVAALQGMRGELWWRGECALLAGVRTVPDADAEDCSAFKNAALSEIERRRDVKIVILAGRWPSYLLGTNPEQGGSYRTHLVSDTGNFPPTSEGSIAIFETSLAETVQRIVGSGKRVVLMGTVPEPGFDVPVMTALAAKNGAATATTLPRAEVQVRNLGVDRVLGDIAARLPGVHYVRLWDSFCDDTRCSLQWNDRPAYSDDDHVSYGFAKHGLSNTLATRWPNGVGTGELSVEAASAP